MLATIFRCCHSNNSTADYTDQTRIKTASIRAYPCNPWSRLPRPALVAAAAIGCFQATPATPGRFRPTRPRASRSPRASVAGHGHTSNPRCRGRLPCDANTRAPMSHRDWNHPAPTCGRRPTLPARHATSPLPARSVPRAARHRPRSTGGTRQMTFAPACVTRFSFQSTFFPRTIQSNPYYE